VPGYAVLARAVSMPANGWEPGQLDRLEVALRGAA
jgi:hypothetical protein